MKTAIESERNVVVDIQPREKVRVLEHKSSVIIRFCYLFTVKENCAICRSVKVITILFKVRDKVLLWQKGVIKW